MRLKFQKLRDNAVLPFAATEMSGAMDVTIADIEYIKDNVVKVYLGLAMQPEEGYRIRFVPRSSFTKYNWVLQNSPCLGDADYTQEYQLNFRALPTFTLTKDQFGYDIFPYKIGDRCAQMYVDKIIPIEFELVKEFENITDRIGGFGSTGK